MTRTRVRRLALIVALAGAAVLLLALVGPAAGNSSKHNRKLATINLDRLPIANGFAARHRDREGLLREARHRDQEDHASRAATTSCWRCPNGNGDIGYIGWVPAIIARSQGIPIVTVSASDVEATSIDDNWQNVMVKGSSSIRTPKDLAGKTIAVNALKGVGEIVIQGGAQQARRRPELDQVRRDPVPGDARGAERRPGRRDLRAGAVHDAGADHRRRPDRPRAGADARQVLAERHATSRASDVGEGQPGARTRGSTTRWPSRSPTRRRIRRRSGRCCRRRLGTSGCRSGAR